MSEAETAIQMIEHLLMEFVRWLEDKGDLDLDAPPGDYLVKQFLGRKKGGSEQ